ncbi:unnamed protein product [Rhodiola kirilowii]
MNDILCFFVISHVRVVTCPQNGSFIQSPPKRFPQSTSVDAVTNESRTTLQKLVGLNGNNVYKLDQNEEIYLVVKNVEGRLRDRS